MRNLQFVSVAPDGKRNVLYNWFMEGDNPQQRIYALHAETAQGQWETPAWNLVVVPIGAYIVLEDVTRPECPPTIDFHDIDFNQEREEILAEKQTHKTSWFDAGKNMTEKIWTIGGLATTLPQKLDGQNRPDDSHDDPDHHDEDDLATRYFGDLRL